MENHEYEEQPSVSKEEKTIRRLQNALYLISSVHCGDGHGENETCVYCGTEWPCFTARVARKSATYY